MGVMTYVVVSPDSRLASRWAAPDVWCVISFSHYLDLLTFDPATGEDVLIGKPPTKAYASSEERAWKAADKLNAKLGSYEGAVANPPEENPNYVRNFDRPNVPPVSGLRVYCPCNHCTSERRINEGRQREQEREREMSAYVTEDRDIDTAAVSWDVWWRSTVNENQTEWQFVNRPIPSRTELARQIEQARNRQAERTGLWSQGDRP